MLSAKEQQLLDALASRAQKEGIEIVTIEVVGAKKAPTIRVYIDTLDPETGVGFEDIVSAQAWINDIMDAIDPFPGAYTLEVSSPGIDRPLRTPAHFAAQVGNTAVVKTSVAVGGSSSFTGTVVSATSAEVVLECNGDTVSIPFSDIKRAHLKGEIDFSS